MTLTINKNFKPVKREITVRRQIHPVGHGAFITEQFYDDDDKCKFTVVYDCGSSKKSVIDKSVNNFFKDDIKVNVLFISHFDKDHVNGLPELAKRFSDDVKVFIPLYYKELLPIYQPNKVLAIKLVLKTLKAYHIQPIYVTYNPITYTNTAIDITERPKNGRIYSGTRLRYWSKDDILWEYVPFNLFDETVIYRHLRNLNINLSDKGTWTDENIKNIRSVYHDIKKKHKINENSLIVLSHLAKGSEFDLFINNNPYSSACQNCVCCECDSYKMNKYTASLYTGDSVLKASSETRKRSLNHYETFMMVLCKHYAPVISLFQVPHHGSTYNSNSETLADNMICRLFINCKTHSLSPPSNKPCYIIDDKQYYSEEISIHK